MVRTFTLLALTLALAYSLSAQTPAEITVQLSATAQVAPPQITLHWPADINANSYTVYRKAKGVVGWGSIVATLAGTDTSYVDATVAVGDAWEYRISKVATGYNGVGYCFAGLERPVQDYLGKLLLVVDTTYAAVLSPALRRLENDLWGDGWQVIRLDVDRADSVTGIHDRIQAEWMADPVNVRTVFLLGHVPVPYSGNINPDGHGDHQGAWPADAYYGEMNGTWTDLSVNNSSAARPQNVNTIGDGKFDQSSIPSDVDLEVGRVDFANMPAFTEGEAALLQRYLDKDHAWRQKQFTVQDSAVIDDNFGFFGGEAFAASGWRNFGSFVGARHVYAGDFRTELNARDHLWAYGCGGGWYQGAGGVGSTTDFVGDSLRAVFSMLFGSYHGDWDSDDNFMRAALANKGTILSCAWAGRPNWHFQYMGLGEPIGAAARASQNNFSTYTAGYGARFVHIALMGDPSLRMQACAPPSDLVVTIAGSGNAHELNWTASPDAVLGYAIFRQDTLNGRFWRIGSVGMNTTTYTDACMLAGTYRYMVRAEEVRSGYSGSYHNLSQGIMDTITNATVYDVQTALASPMVFCPGDTVQVPYTTGADFCTGNVFTAELSDSTGDFSSAVVLGNATALSSGTIVGIIPPATVPAVGYRIRVTASNPAVIGADNGGDLTVSGMPAAGFTYNLVGPTYSFLNTSTGAVSYLWDFGTGDTSQTVNPVYTYASGGSFLLTMIAYNACGSDTVTELISIAGIEDALLQAITIAPNPSSNWVEIRSLDMTAQRYQIAIFDILGQQVYGRAWQAVTPLRIETTDWASGVYHVEIQSPKGIARKKLIVN